MRRRWIAAVFLTSLSVALLSPARALEVLRAYPCLTLKNGRQFTAVQIVACSGDRVLMRHGGGATSLRTDLLPDLVLADLRQLSRANGPAYAPEGATLADKVAVEQAIAEPALAEKIAVAEDDARVSEAIADRVAVAPSSSGIRSNPASFAGWVAVTLPSGETHLLANVEIAAYPAEVLNRCLTPAAAKSAERAQQLREQATVAAREGRPAASAALFARATKTATAYVDLLPAAPYVTRTDAFGRFTLRHDLGGFRLVAVARVPVPQGECTFAWIGVLPGDDGLLTEANATVVAAPPAPNSTFAAR